MKRRCGLVSFALLLSCSEPVVTVPPELTATLAWINQSAHPLASVEPVASTADLAPVLGMIGTAHLIGLGEATHGSREFFTMKDRLFRYLVENGGVTAFAIEASMPEAFAIDTYVRTGVGNPAVLLSHLYFWTWNTKEVADLIAWLRQWNQQHPTKQVGFYGFDMQYPGVAIDSVKSYVARAMPALSASIADNYMCATNYRNDTRGLFAQKYVTAPASVQSTCAVGMVAVSNLLKEYREPLVAASSERDFELALWMAHLVSQWEILARGSQSAVRDRAMAENVEWLLDREGSEGRIVLWAHNYHISRINGFTPTMGGVLAGAYGTDYLPIGFGFESGGLNAIEGIAGGTFGKLKSFTAPPAIEGSYDRLFSETNAPNFLLDLRTASGDGKTWLIGPHQMRNIGSTYFPATPDVHYGGISMPSFFDVLIFVRTTTPSTLLPFQY